ncbi:MAG: hypothetical protein L6Q97_15550 [Thermoanaerobaculia bacterium]|nr:hypothetical protein [Thermoanaerobaculia bacterium]
MNCLRPSVLPVAVFCFAQTLFAQNDMRVFVGEALTPTTIAEGATVTYFVRFQNTGPDTVYQVILRDTLDPRLDISTFAMVDSSHPCQLVRDGSNIIRWYFDDIALPNHATAGPNSVGYVIFSVQPKPFLAPGQTILNQVCATFDQTISICTNEAIIRIEYDPASIGEPGQDREIKIIPNPNHGYFEVRSASTPDTSPDNAPATEWWISDIAGRIVWDGRAENVAAASHQVLLERPAPGLYLLWMKTDGRLRVKEFAVIR